MSIFNHCPLVLIFSYRVYLYYIMSTIRWLARRKKTTRRLRGNSMDNGMNQSMIITRDAVVTFLRQILQFSHTRFERSVVV